MRERDADQLERHRDVVRMRDPAIRSADGALRSGRARGRGTSSACPSDAIAQYFSAFAATNTPRPGDQTASGADAAPGALREHREERGRIRDLHRAIDVAGGLDRAERAQRPIVARRDDGLDRIMQRRKITMAEQIAIEVTGSWFTVPRHVPGEGDRAAQDPRRGRGDQAGELHGQCRDRPARAACG